MFSRAVFRVVPVPRAACWFRPDLAGVLYWFVLDKVDFYLRIGVRLIWLVDPEGRSVTVYRRGTEPHVLGADGVLDAEPVVDGFRLPIAELFCVAYDDA